MKLTLIAGCAQSKRADNTLLIATLDKGEDTFALETLLLRHGVHYHTHCDRWRKKVQAYIKDPALALRLKLEAEKLSVVPCVQ